MREVGVVGAVAVAVPAGGQAAAVRIEVHCRRRVEVLAVGGRYRVAVGSAAATTASEDGRKVMSSAVGDKASRVEGASVAPFHKGTTRARIGRQRHSSAV